MRFPAAQLFVTALTLSGASLALITGPFNITIVPEDGSASYPATVATVSRGAQILSSALEYGQEFTFNTTSGRIFKADTPTNGNGLLTVDSPLLFNSATGDALEQITVDDAVYLVKGGTTSDGIYAWWSSPTTTGLAVQVNYEGASSADANAALRVDVEAS
ncbi:hypothetical protein BJ170DRAFT_717693 [Xylariales sp. AK1849]|nr:hypothetical protein BJ170DRAFT_717693 [Xylariales sp. AK1849]